MYGENTEENSRETIRDTRGDIIKDGESGEEGVRGDMMGGGTPSANV